MGAVIEDRPEAGIAAALGRLLASALTKARGTTAARSTAPAKRFPSVRTTSIRRGWSMTADLWATGEDDLTACTSRTRP